MHHFVLRYAEIALKGKNRRWFENLLVKNIKQHLKAHGLAHVVGKVHGRMMVDAAGDPAKIIEILRHIPGIQNFSPALACSHDWEQIKAAALQLAQESIDPQQAQVRFRVSASRANKKFPMKSQELNRELGGVLLTAYSNLKVDLEEPELTLGVEVWEHDKTVLFLQKIEGQGGLPVGVSGNVFSFLSGGIDSPVSSWMMMKRGCKAIYLNFDSYPFTSEQSRQKVVDLVERLSRYQVQSTLILVPFANIQKAIKANCQERNRTILYRRMMFQIANALRKKYRIKAYVTGEAVGQVASQTLENIACTQDAAELPVLRPLIGMEKTQIMEMARQIGTYPISIQPYDDCCTVFQPKNPETKGRIPHLRHDASLLDEAALIEEAVANLEIIEVETRLGNKFF